MNVILEKYHGLGNDYLVFDPNKNTLVLSKENIRLICDRNFGVGSDGIVVGPIMEDQKISMRIFNPDGSEAENSGNGVRILAKYLKDAGYVQKDRMTFHTLGGEISVQYLNEEGTRLKASMGRLSYWSDETLVSGPKREVVNETMIFGRIPYRVTCVSIGNPHCVIFLNEISKDLVCRIGKYAEESEYFPEKVNTQLLKVIDRNHIEIEIYERGVGYTLASGSCGCAAAGAAFKQGLTDPHMYVHMPGGTLEIEILNDGMVLMSGDVGYVGKITLGNHFTLELKSLS